MSWPPAGGNWEGGGKDRQGRRWVHEPNKGWRPDDSPPPFLDVPEVQYKVRKMAAHVPISEEMAMDLGLIPDTRPAPPPPTLRQRARAKVRGTIREARWRLAAKIGGMSREAVEEESWLW
ncbi:hypothetical protein AB0I81_22835 [Nonomuraea sp. NPDC050404]|uniref:hypothetical protein n=1 Tax=Nonomuraea sp. NPDC050404 TaxID=3155783 RepID=UPI0033C84772